jgi:hypothetical protein
MATGFDRVEHQATNFKLARDIDDLPAAPFALGAQQIAHARIATRRARSGAANLGIRIGAIARQTLHPETKPTKAKTAKLDLQS